MALIEKDYKDAVRRITQEVIMGGNFDVFDELFAPDFADTDRFGINGRDDVRQGMQEWRSAFPDLSLTNETMVQDGDTVMWTERQSGTHQGEFMGVPATNRRLEGVLTMHEATFNEDGQMLTHRQIVDEITYRTQLGLMDDDRENQARPTTG